MVDRNDTFTREVDEELRRDQLAKLWEKYNTLILGGAVAILVAVAGNQLLQSRRIAAEQAAGASFEAAQRLVSASKFDEASKAFQDLAQSGPAGYAALASLQTAAIDAKQGRTEQALATFEKLAKTSGTEPLLRDFAKLQAAAIRASSADFTEMQNRLNDLAAAENPWHATARELLATAALKAGKTSEARSLFEQLLSDRRTPPSVKERARIAMSRIVEAEQGKTGAAAVGNDGKGAATPETPKK